MKIQFGDVYWTNLNPQKHGEIGKIRPCVIVSNQNINNYSNYVIICPITSQLKETTLLSEEMLISFNNEDKRIILYFLRSINKKRLKEFAYSLTENEKNIMRKKLFQLLG